MNPTSCLVAAGGLFKVKSLFNVSCTILPMPFLLLLSMLQHDSVLVVAAAGGPSQIGERDNLMEERDLDGGGHVVITEQDDDASGRGVNIPVNFGQLLDPSQRVYPPFALIILNQPITTPYFAQLRARARLTICADGGFAQLIEYCCKNNVDVSKLSPNVIVGDLDSLSPIHREIAKGHGIKIVHVEDQNLNDFEKSIKQIEEESVADSIENLTIVAVGALDGRLDHTLASLSILYQFPQYRLYLISDSSMATLLSTVHHHQRPLKQLFRVGPRSSTMMDMRVLHAEWRH